MFDEVLQGAGRPRSPDQRGLRLKIKNGPLSFIIGPAQKPRPEGIETFNFPNIDQFSFEPAQKPRPEGIETPA